MKQAGHLYVIGVGPAGPRTATMQALDTIKEMDSIIAVDETCKLFRTYIDGREILFDPWQGFWHYHGKHFLHLNNEEMTAFREERFNLRDERVKIIEDRLEKGEKVGLLDNGNQCLFGPAHWYIEQLDPNRITIIPGMGADIAALAALKNSIMPAYDTRFVMQTAPPYLKDWDQMIKDMKSYPASMILYMTLDYSHNLFEGLKQVYPEDMPCAVVFWAGFPDKEMIIRGTISNMEQKIARVQEKFMGLLFIGRFLEGKPYEAVMRRQ